MSRIHEALKRAEEQKPPAWKPSEPTPLGFGGDGDSPVARGASHSPIARGTPTAGRGLRLEELRQRCTKPGWELNPDYDVFSTKQSSSLCAEQFRTLRSHLYRLRERNPVRTLLVTSP